MKMSKFATTFLNASDVEKPTVITINEITEEKVGSGNKAVIYCSEFEQGITLGKTTISQLIEIFGTDDSDEWIGQSVIVFNDKSVMFEGKRVGGIRFRNNPANKHVGKAGKHADPDSAPFE